MFDYQAQQPDELSLERGDVVKVYRKMADGMSLTRYTRKLLIKISWDQFLSYFESTFLIALLVNIFICAYVLLP